MPGRKPILAIAAGWTLVVLVLGASWRVEALSLLLLLGLVIPALASLPGANRDERERALDREASHLALGTVYLLAAGVVIHALLVRGTHPDPRWYLVLALPLLVRPLVTVGRGRGPRILGLGLGAAIGIFWLAFALLGHGFGTAGLIESSVGVAILLGAAAGLRWPRAGGGLLVALGILFAVMLGARLGHVPGTTAALMVLLLPLPLLVAGGALLVSGPGERSPEK